MSQKAWDTTSTDIKIMLQSFSDLLKVKDK